MFSLSVGLDVRTVYLVLCHGFVVVPQNGDLIKTLVKEQDQMKPIRKALSPPVEVLLYIFKHLFGNCAIFFLRVQFMEFEQVDRHHRIGRGYYIIIDFNSSSDQG